MRESWQPLAAVWTEGMGRKRLMKLAGCSSGAAQRFLAWKRSGEPDTVISPPKALPTPTAKQPDLSQNVSVEYAANHASITTTSPKITNLDQALSAAKVDLSRWEVEKHIINYWDVSAKSEDGFKTVTNFQIKVWLKPRVANLPYLALKELTADIVGKGPVKPHTPVIRSNDPHMLEISIFDLHFGKLAWSAETGTDYDIKIAETLFRNAILCLLDSTKSFHVDKILLPIGSDFLHVNSNNNTTVNNTPQDVDTRLAKIFKAACRVVIDAINDCAKVAPVKVMFVPGNHDAESAFYLCSYLEAWYHRHGGVTVDVGPTARKYERYGTTLIGFTHGNEEKINDLPLIMAGERSDWSEVTHREMHIGHYHKAKEMRFVAGDTVGPVVVRILPSLSGTDAWHHRKGYCNGNRAAEAYLWSHRDGYKGHFSANVAK